MFCRVSSYLFAETLMIEICCDWGFAVVNSLSLCVSVKLESEVGPAIPYNDSGYRNGVAKSWPCPLEIPLSLRKVLR